MKSGPPPIGRARLEAFVRRAWFSRTPGGLASSFSLLASPLCLITALDGARRRRRIRALAPPRVPVIVVGNLVAGGAGKTPTTIALVRELARRGWSPGIVARGHRARDAAARLVSPETDPREGGDEPVLIARATHRPVAAGRHRGQALDCLLDAHPDVDVVVSDDGLQHPHLPRSIELVLFDERGAGNGRLLPAGPLREPLARAAGVDAIIVPANVSAPLSHPRLFHRRIEIGGFTALADGRTVSTTDMAAMVDADAVALAGIAEPARFFATLRGLGIHVREHPLPDHAPIDRAWLRDLSAPVILMTEKDAVKCSPTTDDRLWSLQVRVELDPAFFDWLEPLIRGQPTA
ncbi:MAG: tetraacyldisaccharide 4'-kinase [Burkholderiaceae bacterium]